MGIHRLQYTRCIAVLMGEEERPLVLVPHCSLLLVRSKSQEGWPARHKPDLRRRGLQVALNALNDDFLGVGVQQQAAGCCHYLVQPSDLMSLAYRETGELSIDACCIPYSRPRIRVNERGGSNRGANAGSKSKTRQTVADARSLTTFVLTEKVVMGICQGKQGETHLQSPDVGTIDSQSLSFGT